MEDTYEKGWLDAQDPKVEAPAVTEDKPVDAGPSAEAAAMQVGAKAAKDAQASEFSQAFHADEPKPAETFKQAFARNRKDGAKVFEFNGKKYTTNVASKNPVAASQQIKPSTEAPSAASQTPAPMSDKSPAPKTRQPDIDAGSFTNQAARSVKAKLDDSVEATGQRHANGKPNLAPAK